MVTVSDFSSVLEVGFAVNGLTYAYMLYPFHQARLKEHVERLQIARKGAEEVGAKLPYISGDVSTEWAYSFIYLNYRGMLGYMSAVLAVACIILLIASAFFPDQKIWTFLMSTFLVFVFGVPVCLISLLRSHDMEWEEHVIECGRRIEAAKWNAENEQSSNGHGHARSRAK